jgi:hypothetical protein
MNKGGFSGGADIPKKYFSLIIANGFLYIKKTSSMNYQTRI